MSGDPRKTLRRYEVLNQPRFLTFSCHDRLPLFGSDAIKDLFVEVLEAARDETGFSLLAWVVMPEHVHLIVVPDLPKFPIAAVLARIKRPFSRRVLGRWRQIDAPILRRLRVSGGAYRFWQAGGGYDRNLPTLDDLAFEIDYIHMNPITRGLVDQPVEWKWSSARRFDGLDDGPSLDEPPI